MSSVVAVPGLAEIEGLLRSGRRSEALARARRRCIAEPSDPRPLALVAAAGTIDDGVAACRRMVCLQPGAAWAHRNLSRALDGAQAAGADRALRRCLVLAPDDDRALDLLAGRVKGAAADRFLGALASTRSGDARPAFRRGMLRVLSDRTAASVEPLLEALSRAESVPASMTVSEREAAVFYALSGLLRRRDVVSSRRMLDDGMVAAVPAVTAFFAGLLDLAEGRLADGFGRISTLGGRTPFDIVDLVARFTPERIEAAVSERDCARPSSDPEWLVRGPAPQRRPVLLVSADPSYACSLAPALIETAPPNFGIHLHLLFPPSAAPIDTAPILEAVRSAGGSVTAEALATANRTALITRRYEMLPGIMGHYGSAVAVADADMVFGPAAGPRLAAAAGSIRLAFQDRLLPWICYDANFVWVSDDPTGRRFAAALSRLLRAIDPDTAPWFADQMALFAVIRYLARDGVRPLNLLDHLTVGNGGVEDLVKLTAGSLAAKSAHLARLRRSGFFRR